jgi:hypothetical protein
LSKKASLDVVRMRLNRTRKHVKELKAAESEFMRTDPDARSAIHYDQKPGEVLVTVHLPNGFPIDLGGIISDAFHQLRAALDNLAYQLVRANDETPDGKTEFPIFKDEAIFDRDAPRKMRGMSDPVRATIEGLQPFREWPEHPEHTTIWLIHDLNKIDKHRIPQLACLWIATCKGEFRAAGDVGAKWVHVAERGAVEHGATLLRLTWDRAAMLILRDQQVIVDLDISADVAIKSPERTEFLDPDGIPTDALPITHFLDAALDYCDTRLIPSFAQEFE